MTIKEKTSSRDDNTDNKNAAQDDETAKEDVESLSENVAFEQFSRFRPKESIRNAGDEPDALAQKEWAEHYAHLDKQKELDLGAIGKIIGHGFEKLGNIAFIVIIICFIIIVGIEWHITPLNSLQKDKTTSTLFSIITLSLGYLFGKTNTREK
jgi:hypothetical protein